MSEQNTDFSFPIVKETKYLIFILQENKEKTNVYGVLSAIETFTESGILPRHVELGTIKWHGAYRKYAFFPEPDTIFDSQCLSDIADFINQRMQERNKSKTC